MCIPRTMAHSYQIDAKLNIVYLTFRDRITDEEIRAERLELRQDPRFDPRRPIIIDLRAVTDFAVTPDFMRNFGSTDREYAGTRRAFVTTSKLAYGMVRIYQTLQEPNPVAIFDTMEKAEAWVLGEEAQTSLSCALWPLLIHDLQALYLALVILLALALFLTCRYWRRFGLRRRRAWSPGTILCPANARAAKSSGAVPAAAMHA